MFRKRAEPIISDGIPAPDRLCEFVGNLGKTPEVTSRRGNLTPYATVSKTALVLHTPEQRTGDVPIVDIHDTELGLGRLASGELGVTYPRDGAHLSTEGVHAVLQFLWPQPNSAA